MEPIFDSSGQVVGWISDGSLVNRSNDHVAFLHEGAVFSYQRGHLGTFDQGFFRDQNGHAVAFVEGAHGGPVKPIQSVPPVPAVPPVPPVQPVAPVAPIPPNPSLSWSSLSWDEFMLD